LVSFSLFYLTSRVLQWGYLVDLGVRSYGLFKIFDLLQRLKINRQIVKISVFFKDLWLFGNNDTSVLVSL